MISPPKLPSQAVTLIAAPYLVRNLWKMSPFTTNESGPYGLSYPPDSCSSNYSAGSGN